MTKFESRPLPTEAALEGFGPPAVLPGPVRRIRPATPPGMAPPGSGSVAAVRRPRFHSLAEHEFDVVVVISAEGRIKFVSASAERLLGYDISDAIGRDAFSLFDSFSVGPVRALFSDLVARRRLSVSLEMRTLGPTGRPSTWTRWRPTISTTPSAGSWSTSGTSPSGSASSSASGTVTADSRPSSNRWPTGC